MSKVDHYRNKIKAAEKWIADEKENLRDMERRHLDERQQGRDHLAMARTTLALNQAAYNALAPEPWCNHDAVAASRGLCECGVHVSKDVDALDAEANAIVDAAIARGENPF